MNNSSFTETCQTVWPHQSPHVVTNCEWSSLFFLWFLVAAGESELVPWAVLSSQILEKWRRTNCYVDEFCFVKPTGAGRPIRALPHLSQRGRGACASQEGGLTWWKSRGVQNELLMDESSLEVLNCMTRSVAGSDWNRKATPLATVPWTWECICPLGYNVRGGGVLVGHSSMGADFSWKSKRKKIKGLIQYC